MIFRKKSKFPINSWSNRFVGETSFVIGNGPSLLENDLTLLKDYFVIGINRAFRVILPTILIWQDKSLFEDCYNDLAILPCAKLTIKEIDEENLFSHFSLVPGQFSFEKSTIKLNGSGCSIPLATQLSYSMGCSSIVLLGFDCCYKNNQTDFYGINQNHNSRTLGNFSGAMNWLFSNSPIPIYNCGYASLWPRISLEEAIEKTNPKKKPHLKRLNELL